MNQGGWEKEGEREKQWVTQQWDAQERKALQRVVKTIQKVIGTHLSSISDIGEYHFCM